MSRTALFTKTNIIAGVVVIVVAATGALTLLNQSPQQSQQSTSAVLLQEASLPLAEVREEYVSYAGQDGKNALELLKTHADVRTESSSFGELVKSINDQDGSGQKYWTFYVNGEMAQVGAGAYQTKNGDKIEWKLQ